MLKTSEKHCRFRTEMESKKEALREMVGRRYRDIIEASSEVRRVRDLAQQLSASLASARSTPATGEIRLEVYSAISLLTRFCSLTIASRAFFTPKMRVPQARYSRQCNILLPFIVFSGGKKSFLQC